VQIRERRIGGNFAILEGVPNVLDAFAGKEMSTAMVQCSTIWVAE
jgi:hypothetical protein